MARRKINWTEKANFERKEILEYWINRNKSKTYSIKLNKLFIDAMIQMAEFPTIGRKTDFDNNVRLKIVRDYLFSTSMIQNKLKFYQFGMEIEMNIKYKINRNGL